MGLIEVQSPILLIEVSSFSLEIGILGSGFWVPKYRAVPTDWFFGDLNKLVVHQENSFKSILSVNPPQATSITTIFFEIECHLPLQLQL